MACGNPVMPPDALPYVTDDGQKYRYTTEIVDTDYGPERTVTLWRETGGYVGQNQECGYAEQLIEWLLENEQEADRLDAELYDPEDYDI